MDETLGDEEAVKYLRTKVLPMLKTEHQVLDEPYELALSNHVHAMMDSLRTVTKVTLEGSVAHWHRST